MINPDEKIPVDDSSSNEAEDQQSQKDIHSNGLDEKIVEENHTNKDLLDEAYRASESAYTLNTDDKTENVPDED
ncbi:hypothetical protein [Pedobacter aquatilis]|uniref:hypothetical protein n=1 Tax=Pedobacter aquatilis TaxID=351343 RepID=UPI0029305671|nr:hypothetical protein [Pedobacter aquatilis]